MKHIDLYSGIGGFALAAKANGLRTIQFVEIDEKCRRFLEETWPGVPIHGDIKTFKPTKDHAGTFLLTAGVPCQPVSYAGFQKGSNDPRWLWPETLGILSEIKPTWAIFENPLGIGRLELAGILSEVEASDYSVRVFNIPACAVGTPHRRERLWIVAHSRSSGRQREKPVLVQTAMSPGDLDTALWGCSTWINCIDNKFRRAPDHPSSLADGIPRSILAALGNSIVPQVAMLIINSIIGSYSYGG